MDIFLSCECERPVSKTMVKFFNEFQPLLNKLRGKNYGEELVDIGIISIVMSKESLEDWYGERRLFKRKTKEADIRLFLDYEKLILNISYEEKKQIYIQHIIDSIETVRKKVSKDFKFDELVEDVKKLLHSVDSPVEGHLS